jgi:hypothetical protein
MAVEYKPLRSVTVYVGTAVKHYILEQIDLINYEAISINIISA